MNRALIAAAVLAIATTASKGDVVFMMDSASTATYSGGVYSGSFDVYLSVGAGDSYDISAWQATIQSASSGFNITSVASASGSVFASLSHTDQYSNPVGDTTDVYQGGEALDSGTPPTLTNGVVLMTVNYETASLGTFNVNFMPTYDTYPMGPGTPVPVSGGLRLWDGSYADIPFTYTNGTLVVTPEPATLALLAAGGVLMLARRKRRQQAKH